MEHRVFTKGMEQLPDSDRRGMFRLRYDTFHTRLGWDVQTTEDCLEMDSFDKEPAASYILAKSANDEIDACWRLLPTLGPNMLRDTFPQLLDGAPAPAAPDVWEMSRFALAQRREGATDEAVQHSFAPLSIALMAEAANFAAKEGIVRYVTVTTTAIERMLQRQGLHIHRLGTPQRIGRVMTVAIAIEVDDWTLDAVARGMASTEKAN